MNNKRNLFGKPGVYTITHLPTGKFYIGSTGNVSSRISQHVSELIRGKHGNHLLQKVVKSETEIEVTAIYTDSADKAQQAEQELLDLYHGHDNCCNIGTGSKSLWAEGRFPDEVRKRVSDSLKGNQNGKGHLVTEEMKDAVRLANTGLKRSPETIEKMRVNGLKPVAIDGVRYESVSNAAKGLGVHETTVWRRITSDLKKWDSWNYD